MGSSSATRLCWVKTPSAFNGQVRSYGLEAAPTTGGDAAILQHTDLGIRLMTVASSSVSSGVDLETPPWSTLELTKEGDALVLDARNEVTAVLARPWARDSRGRALTTRYVISGDRIKQQTTGTGSQPPIVQGMSIIPQESSQPPYPYARTAVAPAPAASAAGGVLLSPAGCRAKADYPHHSSHLPGTVNFEARVICNRRTSPVTVAAELWENRWWGWNKIGYTPGPKTGGAGSKLLIKTNAWDYCRNRTTYRGTANGKSVESGRVCEGEDISTSFGPVKCPSR